MEVNHPLGAAIQLVYGAAVGGGNWRKSLSFVLVETVGGDQANICRYRVMFYMENSYAKSCVL